MLQQRPKRSWFTKSWLVSRGSFKLRLRTLLHARVPTLPPVSPLSNEQATSKSKAQLHRRSGPGPDPRYWNPPCDGEPGEVQRRAAGEAPQADEARAGKGDEEGRDDSMATDRMKARVA